MSVHPQHLPWGVAGPSTYAASPPPMHQPHPALGTIYSDSNLFRHVYASELARLNFNSRPMIQFLSEVAQLNHQRMANIVVQCIEAHIRRVHPSCKLYAWYLLDALSKNVPVPYAGLFSPLVSSLFLESYHQVDPPTRGKMEEMLQTWRTGGQNGREVFGVVPQVAIERAIWAQGSASVRPSVPLRQTTQDISKAKVLADIEVTLAQKQHAVQANPFDTASVGHIDVLQQLRTVVQTSNVKQDELAAIDKQLRQLRPSVNSTVVSASFENSSPPFIPNLIPPGSQAPQALPNDLVSSFLAAQQVLQTSSGSLPQRNPAAFMQAASAPDGTLRPSQLPSLTPSLDHSVMTAPSHDLTGLFNSLSKAGVFTAPVAQTSKAGTSSTAAESTEPSMQQYESARQYERELSQMQVNLTSAGILKNRVSIPKLLYDRMPIRCQQCAVRVESGPAGQAQMANHLDMHFRRNQKAGLTTGRGHSRSLFVSTQDWCHELTSSSHGSRSGGQAAKAAADAAAEEAKLKEKYVVVPTGDEGKVVRCPICKESLKSQFLEDDEEWVWKNAVNVQGKIYHATCHAETSTANSLAARLRSEAANEHSRSGTPDVGSNRSSTPRVAVAVKTEPMRSQLLESGSTGAGSKRKLEDDGDNIERSDSPKRVARSPQNL